MFSRSIITTKHRKTVCQKQRMDKLDNLLLFALSSTGLIFVIVQYLVGEIAILLFLPLIILGMIIPLKVGYFGGALQNSVENRLRGWLHFFAGVGIYVLFTVMMTLLFRFNVNDLFVILAFSILSLVIFWLISKPFVIKIANWYGYRIARKDVHIIFMSTLGAIICVESSVLLGLGVWLSMYVRPGLTAILYIVYTVGLSVALYMVPVKLGFYRE